MYFRAILLSFVISLKNLNESASVNNFVITLLDSSRRHIYEFKLFYGDVNMSGRTRRGTCLDPNRANLRQKKNLEKL